MAWIQLQVIVDQSVLGKHSDSFTLKKKKKKWGFFLKINKVQEEDLRRIRFKKKKIPEV